MPSGKESACQSKRQFRARLPFQQLLLLLLLKVTSVVSDSVQSHRRQPTRLPPSLGFSWFPPNPPRLAIAISHWTRRRLWAASLVVCVCVCACSVAKLCPTLSDPMDCTLPGSSVHGIFQERILECVAITSSRRSSWPGDGLLHWQEDSFTTAPRGVLPCWVLPLIHHQCPGWHALSSFYVPGPILGTWHIFISLNHYMIAL